MIELTWDFASSPSKMTPFEIEICDLYFNQRKTTREIAKEKRTSFSEIGKALRSARKLFPDLPGSAGLSTGETKDKAIVTSKPVRNQVFSMLTSGKTPLEIADDMNLGADELLEYQLEYQKLLRHDKIVNVLTTMSEKEIGAILSLLRNMQTLKLDAVSFATKLDLLRRLENIESRTSRYEENSRMKKAEALSWEEQADRLKASVRISKR